MNIQLCYASTRSDQNDLLEDLSDILAVARKFNEDHNICGVLYYADGAFFECLQGDKDIVENLYQKICKDQRHHSVVGFNTVEIEQKNFKNWSMKYVQRNSGIDHFFKEHNAKGFSPSLLDQTTLPIFLDHLFSAEQSSVKQRRVGMNNRGVSNFL